MSGSKPLIMWLLGGVGLILLYAAFKGKSPTDIIKGTFGGGAAPTTPATGGSTP